MYHRVDLINGRGQTQMYYFHNWICQGSTYATFYAKQPMHNLLDRCRSHNIDYSVKEVPREEYETVEPRLRT
jgi:hypothetical protein